MSKLLEYKGYIGSAEISLDDKCLHGKILFIEDTVTYEAKTLAELEKSFREAVDDYLATCKKLGVTPNATFSGTFNVRIGQELHRKATIQARLRGQTLNDFVREAVEEQLKAAKPVTVVHQHEHYHLAASATPAVIVSKQEIPFEMEPAWPVKERRPN